MFGKGTVERLGEQILQQHVDVVVVDAALTPVQQRNLERAWKSKVIDRTGLILEIFGARARTSEGTMQVELAALSYQRSRLVRSWTHLERQRGGFGFMGGPGETQIEADRRLIDERISRLKRELADVRRTRELHRSARRRVPYPIVALVGYTNAGKSTLFNWLTKSRVVAKDQLFATLDPTMRAMDLPSGKRIILSDTVGFVSDLPHELVDAFRATLEEVIEADVLIHVRDITHPDTEAQKTDVMAVLSDLGVDEADGKSLIEVLNKADRLEADQAQALSVRAKRSNNQLILLSAITGEGCDKLESGIDETLSALRQEISLDVPWTDGATLSWLYKHGEVVNRTDGEESVQLTVRLDPSDAARLEQRQAQQEAV